jgi:hypothetical protein
MKTYGTCSHPGCGYADGKPCNGCGKIVRPGCAIIPFTFKVEDFTPTIEHMKNSDLHWSVEEQLGDDVNLLMQNRRWCYTVPQVQDTKVFGGFVPSIAIEGIAGHYPLTGRGTGSAPWVWGETYAEAEKVCAHKNMMLGYSEREAFCIVASTLHSIPCEVATT